MLFPLNDFIQSARTLGHSEEYIEATSEYIQQLNARKLPVIFDINHFAIELGIPKKQLNFILNNTGAKYSYFLLRKRDGTFGREIMSPHNDLKYIQRWINKNILQKIEMHEACTGFISGKSILDNAEPHSKAAQILKVDLLRFFDTVSVNRVYGVFNYLGYQPKLAYDLAKLTTAKHRKAYWERVKKSGLKELSDFIEQRPAILPQGAPTSPMLANFIAGRMDRKLSSLALTYGFNYTRYADDLTFSSDKTDFKFPLSLITSIIKTEGFFVNNKKTRLYKRGMKQYVTGLTVTHDTNVSKKYRKELMQHLYFSKKFGPQNHLKVWAAKNGRNANIHAFQDWLLGRIAFVYSINRAAAERCFAYYNAIDWVSYIDNQLDAKPTPAP